MISKKINVVFLSLTLMSLMVWADDPPQLGDLDGDGIFTVNDLGLLSGHSSGAAPLPENLQLFADLRMKFPCASVVVRNDRFRGQQR